MSKPYKIKRTRKQGRRGGHFYKAGPHPLSIILTLVVVAGLVFLGVSSYQPIYNFITGERSPQLPNNISGPENSQANAGEAEVRPDPEIETPAVHGLRGVYMAHAIASDTAQRDSFLESLSGTEINAVMVDIKDQQGKVLFQTSTAEAQSMGVISTDAIDLAALSQALSARKLQLIVRMGTFQDEAAAQANRGYSIHYQNTDMRWLDASSGEGKPWLNPYSGEVRGYLRSLARDAVQKGAVMVVARDIQFPNGSNSNATFGSESAGISRTQALSAFVEEMTEAVQSEGGVFSVYYPAQLAVTSNETLYGGSPLNVVNTSLTLGAFPYLFENNFSQGGLTLADPAADPAATVKAVVSHVVGILPSDSAPEVIPMIIGGTESSINGVQYTKEQIGAQTTQLESMGIQSYILHQTNSAYLI